MNQQQINDCFQAVPAGVQISFLVSLVLVVHIGF